MPSGEKKNLVRREVFSGYGGCRPKFGRMVISLFCSVIGVQGLSGDNAEWSFIFFSLSKVLGGVGQSSAEWSPSLVFVC